MTVSFIGCSNKNSKNQKVERFYTKKVKKSSNYSKKSKGNELLNLLLEAEKNTIPSGRKVLKMARIMTVENKEIIRGACWDYINAVFNRAGFPTKKREIIFRGKLKKPPYAKSSLVKGGDWIYHINHSYHGIQHSGLFIKWLDYKNKIALMLSYGGEKRNKPARYKSYDLSNIYYIQRAK